MFAQPEIQFKRRANIFLVVNIPFLQIPLFKRCFSAFVIFPLCQSGLERFDLKPRQNHDFCSFQMNSIWQMEFILTILLNNLFNVLEL